MSLLSRLLPVFVLSASVALAQTAAGVGAISGEVRDASGSVVPNAKVVVSNPSKGITRALNTTASGLFSAGALVPAAGYSVKVSAPGFADWVVNDAELRVGQTLDLKVTMQVASASTQVVVTAEAPLVEDTKVDVSSVIDSKFIQELPINGRRVDSFVLLTPGVTNDSYFGLLSFRGVAAGNSFLVDGADTTEQFYNENAGRTRITTQISQDAVQEFQVVSANYSAEYGRAMGGVVNTVTRSGQNALHGTGYWFFRNQDFNARDPFTAFVPNETRNQGGASIGGAIKKDKLFYFFNYDITRRDFPLIGSIIKAGIVDSTNQVWLGCGAPATPAQCSAINSLLPRFFGTLTRTQSNDLGFGKLDYHLSDRNSFTASFNFLRWWAPNGIQSAVTLTTGAQITSNGDDSVRVRNLKLGWTSVPTPNVINEAYFSWFTDRQADSADPALSSPALGPLVLSVAGQAIGTTNYLPRVEPNETRFQGVDNFSWTKGSHIIKAGADIASSDDYSYFIQNAFGSYTYQTVTNFALDFSTPAGAPSNIGKHWQTYAQAFGNPVTDTTVRNYGFYLEDQWRVNSKLTVTAGARYEYEQLPQPQSNLCNHDYPDTCHINSPGTNLMPRIGVAYRLNDKTVLRAGYGMFYTRTAGATLQDLFSGNGVYTTSITLSGNTPAQLTAGPQYPNILATAPTGATIAASNIQFAAPNWKTPYSQQGNLALERQIGHDIAVTASFIWSRGVQLYSVRDLNRPALSSTNFTYAIDDASGHQVSSYTTPVYLGTTRPDPRYAGIYQDENGVTSSYNALALQARKQFSHGFQANLSYTWAHEIDDGQSTAETTTSQFLSSDFYWYYTGNYKFDKGSGALDQRQRFVLSWSWAPTITTRTGAFYKYVVNNWMLSSITTLASGRPFDGTVRITDSPIPGGFSNFSLNGSNGSSRVPFVPYNNLYSPAAYRSDARITKTIPFNDRYKLFLTFDIFNLSNSWSPTTISTQMYTETKGVLTLTPTAYGQGTADAAFPDGTQARRLQVGARFVF
jgi:outer membrane receptor protein involved in Fe transport